MMWKDLKKILTIKNIAGKKIVQTGLYPSTFIVSQMILP